jgi:hypothetical protein
MRAFICIVGWAIAMPAATAAAQGAADFSTLHLKVGDTIYVTDETTGVQVSGSLRMLSPAQLSIDGYSFAPASHLKIERAGDPIWSGAAVGFSLGALLLYPVVPETFVSTGGRFRINNGLLWGAVGALIDRAHRGRTTVYKGRSSPGRSARLVPQISSRRKGIALALAF